MKRVAWAAAAVIVLLVGQGLAASVPAAVETWRRTDSRSDAIDYLDTLDNSLPVVIPDVLRVHTDDLARLRRPYEIRPLAYVIELFGSERAQDLNLVLPDKLIAVLPPQLLDENYHRDIALLDAIGEKGGAVFGDAILTDAMTVSPKLHVISPAKQ